MKNLFTKLAAWCSKHVWQSVVICVVTVGAIVAAIVVPSLSNKENPETSESTASEVSVPSVDCTIESQDEWDAAFGFDGVYLYTDNGKVSYSITQGDETFTIVYEICQNNMKEIREQNVLYYTFDGNKTYRFSNNGEDWFKNEYDNAVLKEEMFTYFANFQLMSNFTYDAEAHAYFGDVSSLSSDRIVFDELKICFEEKNIVSMSVKATAVKSNQALIYTAEFSYENQTVDLPVIA